MKVLLAGGSGRVGSFVTPYLAKHHDLRVLDLRPPRHEGIEYVEGSVTDPEALRRALDGVDTFLWLVMRRGQGGSVTNQDLPTIVDNYELNTKGLHLLLFTAQEMGVTRGVYTSTMSVHYRKRDRYPGEELTALDTPSVYGLTKGFGELICQYFARWFDMNLIALRITGPREREAYLQERTQTRADRVYPDGTPGGSKIYVVDEEDLADAYLRALEAVQTGHGRFDAIFIAGDEAEQDHNLSKAQRVLGWQPRAQRLLG
ncbi:MAG: NAD-dependent epimerase/dehydratase family protein [Chloroflexota bacterium]